MRRPTPACWRALGSSCEREERRRRGRIFSFTVSHAPIPAVRHAATASPPRRTAHDALALKRIHSDHTAYCTLSLSLSLSHLCLSQFTSLTHTYTPHVAAAVPAAVGREEPPPRVDAAHTPARGEPQLEGVACEREACAAPPSLSRPMAPTGDVR